MFAKFLAFATTGITAVYACTTTTQFTANPITAPTVADYPTIGQPYIIQWDDTNQGPTVTLTLYKGCPNNCVEVGDVVAGAPNAGSYSWVPSCTLLADETNEGYGLLLTDDTLCMTQWSFHFGLHPDNSGVCGGNVASSTTTTAASSIVSSPTSTATSILSSVVSSLASSTTTTTTAKSSGTTAAASTTTQKIVTLSSTSTVMSLSSPKSSVPPTASASAKSDGGSTRPAQALGAFSGVVALFAAAFAL